MDAEQPSLPDFIIPDFAQPELEQASLTTPGFVLPDPAQPEPLIATRLGKLLTSTDTTSPDPALPDLLNPDLPSTLDYPANETHMLPQPSYAPEVTMHQRPGEMAPTALEMLMSSPDEASLPPGSGYPRLYITQDHLSRRARHFGMLELGLEQRNSYEE